MPRAVACGIGDVDLDDLALGPAERLHGHVPAVAADDAPVALLHDQRLDLPEAPQRSHDGVEVPLAVEPGVGRVLVDRVDGHARRWCGRATAQGRS
jgi:hypothetical protein